jgi:hypothetical protein
MIDTPGNTALLDLADPVNSELGQVLDEDQPVDVATQEGSVGGRGQTQEVGLGQSGEDGCREGAVRQEDATQVV